MNNTNSVWLAETTPANPVRPIDPFTTHRKESWRWAVMSNTESPMGDLDGAGAASLEFNVNSTIRSGGNLDWSGRGTMPEWLKIRLQPWYTLRTTTGDISWPLGVFIPAAPKVNYTSGGYTIGLELYDKLLILEQDTAENTFTVPAGANVTDTIRGIIAAAGETLLTIEDSDQTLSSPMVWEIGTTRLKIVNELLEAINYFSLWCDFWGAYHAAPYKSPQTRPVVRTFTDDAASIYAPDFTHDLDTFNVPNRVTLVARSDGDVPALTATAADTDPNSPFSHPSRGRWLSQSFTDVEATSQAVLDSIAARRLRELQQVSSTFDFSHAMVPLNLNDIVRFQQSPNSIDVRAVVQTMSISTAVGELVKTSLRQVVE